MRKKTWSIAGAALALLLGAAVQADELSPDIANPAPPPPCSSVPSGVVAWWRGESNTVDSVSINDGLGAYASLLRPSGLEAFTIGKVGAGFRFTPKYLPLATANYIFVPASAELDVGHGDGLTVEGWIKPDVVSGFQPLIEWNDNQTNIGVGLALNGSVLEAWLAETNSAPTRRVVLRASGEAVRTSIWQHVACTFSKSNGLAILYTNGVVATATNLGNFRPQTRAPIFMAYRPSGSNSLTHYLGAMDEMTIYSRALTAAEIQTIVAADSAGKCPPPPPSCVLPPSDFVAWWRGESNALDNVDSNRGFLLNTVSYDAGVVGTALRFDTLVTGYVRVPAASNLNVGPAAGFTIEAWISPSPDFGLFVPLSREYFGWHVGTTVGVSISITNTTSSIFPTPASPPSVWQADVVDLQGQHHVLRGGSVAQDQWQHVALTYDKTSGQAVLYFNGNPVTQTNLGSFIPKTTGDVYLGYQLTNVFRNLSIVAMDEVSLYARALGESEIRAIMLSRGAGKCRQPPLIVAQPISLRVNPGDTASFHVTFVGNPILRCQWRINGTNLAGMTGESLTLTNVQDAQAGDYSVRVTNWFGSVLSSNAVLHVNHPPVADASATRTPVISPNGTNATSVLDATRSSDPDDDVLQYDWFLANAATLLSTGAVAVVTLPVGTNAVTLVADDGLSHSTQTVVVEVITTCQAVERLLAQVRAQWQRPQPLTATLSAVDAGCDRINPTAASNQLRAFDNQVEAQVAPINSTLAQQFLQSAEAIRNALDTGGSVHSRATFLAVKRQADGKTRLQFSAPRGSLCIVEASANLVHWEQVGVAVDAGDGAFDFEDANSACLPVRFYRIVSP